MFGKIKGKLGDIFKKNEEHLEENADEIVEEVQDIDEVKEEKKGFLGGLFSKKKEEEDLEDLEEIKEHQEEDLAEGVQEAVLEGLSEKEKEEIREGKELSEVEVRAHQQEVETAIEKEEELEKETNEDIEKEKKNEVEDALEGMNKGVDLDSPKADEVQIQEEIPPKLDESQNVETENSSEELLQSGETLNEEKKGFFSKMFQGSKKEDVESFKDSPQDDPLKSSPQIEEKTKEVDRVEEAEGGFFSKAIGAVKKKKITEDDYDKIWMDLEIFLLEINVAFEIVERIGKKLHLALIGNSFDRFALSKKVREVMVLEVEGVLGAREAGFIDEVQKHKESDEPLRIMVLGVNGTGKTTSIGKVIRYLQKHDLSVVVAAADTFRAAAVDQIAKHCENLGVKCIQHQQGGDPAAVAFDAVEHAKAKGIDVVLIDTAGRMPNNSNLMLELQKIKRVSKSQMALFIGDSISGNDLIDQISLFDKGVEINGVALTKVDTDERPGSIVTTAYSIDKPIYFLGVGQGYDDLIEFNAKEIAEKLFDVSEE